MKRLFQICLLSLMALAAMAQTAAQHRLKITLQPEHVMNAYVWYRIGNSDFQLQSDTTALDMMVPAGTIVYIDSRWQGGNGSYLFWQLLENGVEVPFRESRGMVMDRGNGRDYTYYIMPDCDVDLQIICQYTPATPDDQPSTGGWYPDTGTLVMDYSDYRYPTNFNYNADRNKVLRFICAYNIRSINISNRTYDFPNMYFADYSRTAANEVSGHYNQNSYAEYMKNLTDVVLPATITTIDSRAFWSSSLQTLTCYALMPPKFNIMTAFNSETQKTEEFLPFQDTPDIVVCVPAEAVPLYQAADYWKQMTIVPIQANSVSLTVNLLSQPDAATLALYKGMHLELTDRRTAVTRTQLVGPRNSYEFRYLTTNTTYDLVLRSTNGDVAASIENIFVGEADLSVDFSNLRTPRTLTVVLEGDDGRTLDEDDYTVTWMKSDGTYIRRGTTLSNALDGDIVRLFALLGNQLSMSYVQPDTISYTVGQHGADTSIRLQLSPLSATTADFTVIDSQSRQGIGGATVDVAQVLPDGSTGARTLLTTGSDGRATGEVLATMSTVTITSPQHGAQSFSANLADSTAFRTVFVPADGTSIVLSHTYQAAVAEGQTPTVEQGYADGRSLEYTFTATLPDGSETVLTDYLVRYPTYVLRNSLPQGTRVRVSATDTRGTLEPVQGEGTVSADGQVSITLPIVERGYILARYTTSVSSHPAVLLFDARSGELLTKHEFGDRTFATFTNLPNGDYVVAAMSKGPQYQGVNSLRQLQLYTGDQDYVAQTVTVSEGLLAEASFSRVPYTLTQLETNLSERRVSSGTEAKVGYDCTFGVKVAFEGLKERMLGISYDESRYPTDCRLEFYLPEGFSVPTAYRSYRQYQPYMDGRSWLLPMSIDDVSSFISSMSNGSGGSMHYIDVRPGGIAMTAATATWESYSRKLTVEWPHIDEGGRMSIMTVPLEAGMSMPEAYLCYTLGGKQYREVLETTDVSVSKSGIYVQELLVQPSFIVSGTTQYYEEEEPAGARGPRHASSAAAVWSPPEPPYYEVTVMDDGTPIGQAQIQRNGTWQAQCQLSSTTALSKHNIYAVIKPYKWKDTSYQTESKTVVYDPNGVVPLWTKMQFFNHHPVHLENQEVMFNYQTGKASPASYGYSNEDGYNTDFTFEVNLSNNDTTKVYAVALHIWGDGPDGGETITWAHFNKRKGHWIGYAKFNTRNIPNSVLVEPFYHREAIGSRQAADDVVGWFDEQYRADEGEGAQLLGDLGTLVAQGETAAAAGNESVIPTEQLDQKLTQYMQWRGLDIGSAPDVSSKTVEQLIAEVDALWQEGGGIADFFAGISGYAQQLNQLAATMAEGISTGSAAGLSEASLVSQGYEQGRLDDGTSVYTLGREDGGWEFVDLKNNLRISVTGAAAARMDIRSNADGDWVKGLEKMGEYLDKFQDYLGKIAEIAEASITKFNYWIYMAENTSVEIGKKLAAPNLSRMQRWWLESKLELNLLRTSGLEKVRSFCTKFKVGKFAGSLASLYSLFSTYMKFRTNGQALAKLRSGIPNPCPDDQAAADKLRGDIDSFGRWCVPYMIAAISSDVVALVASLGCFAALIPSSGASFSGLVLAIAKIGLTMLSNSMYEERMEAALEVFGYRRSELKCHQGCGGNCPKCVEEGSCPEYPKKKGPGPFQPTTTGTLDPSGFVYEGVMSNRLEGATATVFYKETVKNIYGDEEERVTMWDAENYGQVNPQLTNENGEYGWMVPTGLWQVKYEKEGYRTEYSEWLPVPPPQLDVNQAMMQLGEPQVQSVKATPQQVLVGFDKYMLGTSLTSAGAVSITRQGQPVTGRVELVGAEGLTEQSMLAQSIRFVPATSLPAGQTLTLTVSPAVQSYAGVQMGQTFTQDFDIELVVEQLVADSAVHVVYDETAAVTIQALPAQGAAGRKVSVRVLSDMVATATTDVLILDTDGRATLTLTGEAQGTTAAVLAMADDPDVQTVVVIDVKDADGFTCPMPTADYQSGQGYELGTRIALSCSLPEATIWYTLDGTCPCDSPTAQQYTAPIELRGDMTIKAIARAPGYADSEVAELQFMLTAISSMPVSQPQPAQGTYNMAGQKLSEGSHLGKGVYIIDGRKVVIK